MREVNTTNMTLLIDELVPETAYSIQVCAVFGHTRSPHAQLDAWTLSERPVPGKPVDFRAEFIDVLLPVNSAETYPGDDSTSRVLRVTLTGSYLTITFF